MVKILGDNDTGFKYFTDAAQIIGIQRGMCYLWQDPAFNIVEGK